MHRYSLYFVGKAVIIACLLPFVTPGELETLSRVALASLGAAALFATIELTLN